MPECRQSISASWPRACHITLLYRSSRFSSHSPQPSRLCLYQTYSTRSWRSWPSSSHRIVWGLVRTVLKDVITPHGGSLLSVGILATIWAASGGVAALIEAVNVAYDLPDKRSFVQRRLLAIALMFAVGALAVAALSLLVVGPGFGRWLAGRVGLSAIFVALWPYLRWVLSVSNSNHLPSLWGSRFRLGLQPRSFHSNGRGLDGARCIWYCWVFAPF